MKKFVVVLLFSVLLISGCFKQQVQKSIKSVVHISCPQWQGSGFVVDKHLIATARHVVEGVEDFEITFNCGNKVHATRAISSKEYDIGFIWVDEELPDFMIAKLGSVKDCYLGQDVFVIGSSYGKEIGFNSVTKGIISGLDREWDFTDYDGKSFGWEIAFTTDSATYPGNSGGPLFTMDGRVRGIIVGGAVPCLIAAMPVDLFLNDIEEIKRMFIVDEYQYEKTPAYSSDDYYNHETGSEYYDAIVKR